MQNETEYAQGIWKASTYEVDEQHLSLNPSEIKLLFTI